MLQDGFGLDGPGLYVGTEAAMAVMRYTRVKSLTHKGKGKGKEGSARQKQPLFKMGPVEDTFTTERRAAGRAQKMEDPETKADSSPPNYRSSGEAALQPKWRNQSDLESQDSDGTTPSPRSTLCRLESPPLSPSWGLPEPSQQSPPAGTVDSQQDAPGVDLPNRPPPIHTSPTAPVTPKTSPYSAELCTGYAPFYPEAVEVRSTGLGERCSSYTALPTLLARPKRGCAAAGRVASLIDSYTPKTLEQFLETEEGEDTDDEEPWPEHLCTPDMMVKSRSQPALRNLGFQKQSAQTSRAKEFVLYVNDDVPSILDSEDIMVPV